MTSAPEKPMRLDFAVGMLRILGEPQRWKILRLLLSQEEERLTITDMARVLEVSQPAITKHVKILKKAGFVTSTKEGNRVYCRIDHAMMDHLIEIAQDTIPKGFYPCPYNMRCSECPEKATCA